MLQVWLPLNGNIKNQGLNQNITVTNSGATVNSSGKLGQCYSFNGSSSKIQNTISSAISSNIGSLACWVKFNALPSTSGWFCLMQLGALGGFATCRLGLYFEKATGINISINGSSTGANYQAYAFTTGVWYHICATYDGTRVKLYINGEKQLDKVATTGSYTTAASHLFIGGTSSYFTNGLMNDCRYYDHALSEKEVQEIAKGLVVHYKLDSRFFEATTNLCSSLVQGGRTTVTNNIITNTGENADTYWYIKPKEALVGGATYTVSCYLSGFSSNTKYITWGVCAQSGTNNAGYWYCYNGFNEFTFIMPSGLNGSTANIIFDDQGGTRTEQFTISHIQLEQKDHATGFVDYGKTREADLIYDCSGYQNNAIPTGALTASTDTAKYSCSTSATPTSANAYITGPSLSATTQTISLWVKTSDTQWLAFADNSSDLELAHTNAGFQVAVSNASTSKNQFSDSNYHVGEWNHFVIVKNSASDKLLYVNGEPATKLSTTDYWRHDGALMLFRRDYSTSIQLTGQISDFRVYATALSAAAIKDLYETSAEIDKNGNFYAREVIEK